MYGIVYHQSIVDIEWFQNDQSHTPMDEDDKLQLESEFDESEMNTYNALL